MARSAGFEPATLCLEGRNMYLLSFTLKYYYTGYTMIFLSFKNDIFLLLTKKITIFVTYLLPSYEIK